MITVENLFKTYEDTTDPVLKDIKLEIKDGEFISLVGRSGSGKSTLLYLISTLDRDFKGKIFYDTKNILEMDVNEIHKLRNQNIGFVFQFHYLLSELSALENVLLPARKAGLLKEKSSFAYELLKEVGLEGKEHRLPAKLSGGEQQRVAIARSLIMKPKYIFADEPTGNLDSANGEIIMNLFEKFNREYGMTIVFVTHDLEFAKRAKRIVHITDGVI
jgi:putative ABC transport system ATP-binding protein/lipoprotein-releasing system ATP-binding protein